jgi:hypothetical protein
MELHLLIRARWRWSINIPGGGIPYIRTHTIFRTSSPYYNNLIPSIVLLIPLLKHKLILNLVLNVILAPSHTSRSHVPFCEYVNVHLALTVSRRLP